MMENEEIPEFIIPIKPSDLEEPPTDNRFWVHNSYKNCLFPYVTLNRFTKGGLITAT